MFYELFLLSEIHPSKFIELSLIQQDLKQIICRFIMSLFIDAKKTRYEFLISPLVSEKGINCFSCVKLKEVVFNLNAFFISIVIIFGLKIHHYVVTDNTSNFCVYLSHVSPYVPKSDVKCYMKLRSFNIFYISHY